jgi:phosphoglycolate phosphatase-like HAD superfamily hydrolase
MEHDVRDQSRALRRFQPRYECLVAIDSDGCVFDSMGVKQREFFIPVTIAHWGLEAISDYERETHEWVNLHSRWRGSNRFAALIRVFELLAEREEVRRVGVRLPDLNPLRRWLDTGVAVGQPALEEEVRRTQDPVLARVLVWSQAINLAIEERYKGVPPFRFVRESLAKLRGSADVVCVSATPRDALEREWREGDLTRYVAILGALEMGSKLEQLKALSTGRYPKGQVLMVGDSLGDLAAAKGAGALFYPIIPGEEKQCWRRFHDRVIGLFLDGRYGALEARLVERFQASLPDQPPWLKNDRATSGISVT